MGLNAPFLYTKIGELFTLNFLSNSSSMKNMFKKLFVLFLLFIASKTQAQELFINSPAAANISKGRLEVRNNIMAYDNFRYYHNAFEINYGITGRLTSYNHFYYATNEGYKFIGDFEPMLRYRFYDIDSRNSHIRFAGQLGFRVPVDSRPIVGDAVEYELHPGHSIKVFNFINDITVPITDFHTTDNYTLRSDIIGTGLFNKLAVSAHAGYNLNIPKSDFKFGNYWDFGLSFGYLLYPFEYESYDEVNFNLYVENKAWFFEKNKFINQTIANSGGFRADTYVGLQTIFFSTFIVEGGYKFPLHSNEYAETRIQKRPGAWQFSMRYLFFL